MDKQEKRRITAQYRERCRQGGVYVIRCRENGKRLLLSTTDMQGSINRFEFAQGSGGCVHPKLRPDWDRYGGKAFEFIVTETLEQKEAQTDTDFQREIETLMDMMISQAGTDALY
jgi:hypothetical protein